MVDVIEPNEGRKHADVGLGQLVASEEPLVFEDRIPVVEGVEQFVDGPRRRGPVWSRIRPGRPLLLIGS